MVENLHGKFLSLAVGEIRTQPVGIETDFVHTDQTDCGEVVVKFAKITAGVGIKTLFQQLGNNFTLDFKRTCGDIHHVVKTFIEVSLVFGKVSDTGHIDGDNTDGTGAFTAAEVTAGFLTQFAQVQTQTAAHGTDIAGFHIAVDVV